MRNWEEGKGLGWVENVRMRLWLGDVVRLWEKGDEYMISSY